MVIASVKGNTIKLDLRTADPSGGEGTFYWNTTAKKIKLQNGSGYNNVSGGGGLSAPTIVSKSSNYPMSAADCDQFYIYTNTTTNLVFSLPAATLGLVANFINNQAGAMSIVVNGTDKITDGNGDESPVMTSTKQGDNILLYASATGLWNVATARFPFFDSNSLVYAFVAGSATSSTAIEWWDSTSISTNAASKGTLPAGKWGPTGARGPLYGYWMGGGAQTNVFYYQNDTTTSGGASSRGTISQGKCDGGGGSSSVLIFMIGGDINGSQLGTTVIEYANAYTITGNALASGTNPTAICNNTVVSCAHDGNGFLFSCGGSIAGAGQSGITVLNGTTSLLNAVASGVLTSNRHSPAGSSGHFYGFVSGGHTGSVYSNTIDYLDMTTNAMNALSKGTLVFARQLCSGSQGQRYGYIAAGWNGTINTDSIEYVDMITTTGNASNVGVLSTAKREMGGL